MNRTCWAESLRGTAIALALSSTLLVTAGCGVEFGAAYPIGYDDGYPPDGYIATTEPVYFRGTRVVLVRRSLVLSKRRWLGSLRPRTGGTLPAQNASSS